MFHNLPSKIKFMIFRELDEANLRQTKLVNREFSILTSQEKTERWIRSDNPKHWINLPPSNPKDLKYEVFDTPRFVLRAALRSPEEIMLAAGFKRRDIAPQFFPEQDFSSYAEYQRYDFGKNSKHTLMWQYPFHSLISTFDFTEREERRSQFKKAKNWGKYDEDGELYDDVWIYFVVAYQGIVAKNDFKEISLLAILSTDIIGAIKCNVDDVIEVWFNKNCDLKRQNMAAYLEIIKFINDQGMKISPNLQFFLHKEDQEEFADDVKDRKRKRKIV